MIEKQYFIYGGPDDIRYWREANYIRHCFDVETVPNGRWVVSHDDATIYYSEEIAMKRARRIIMSGSARPVVGWISCDEVKNNGNIITI